MLLILSFWLFWLAIAHGNDCQVCSDWQNLISLSDPNGLLAHRCKQGKGAEQKNEWKRRIGSKLWMQCKLTGRVPKMMWWVKTRFQYGIQGLMALMHDDNMVTYVICQVKKIGAVGVFLSDDHYPLYLQQVNREEEMLLQQIWDDSMLKENRGLKQRSWKGGMMWYG